MDTSSDGGCALYEVTEVTASPQGWPSGRRAVTTATPEASEDMASWNSSGTSVRRAILVVPPSVPAAFGGCDPAPGRVRSLADASASTPLASTPMLGSRSPSHDRTFGRDH